SMAFDQVLYWQMRHRAMRGDPRSVGNRGHSPDEAEKSEAKFLGQLSSVLKALPARGRVLDLGCGYGRAATTFINAGFPYLGVDVSPEAIEEARRRVPGGRFEERDLLDWRAPETF